MIHDGIVDIGTGAKGGGGGGVLCKSGSEVEGGGDGVGGVVVGVVAGEGAVVDVGGGVDSVVAGGEGAVVDGGSGGDGVVILPYRRPHLNPAENNMTISNTMRRSTTIAQLQNVVVASGSKRQENLGPNFPAWPAWTGRVRMVPVFW